MTGIEDLPLFKHSGGSEQLHPEDETLPRQQAPRSTAVRSGVAALSLARSRPVVLQLAARFRASEPGPHRAAEFRRAVVLPLVRQRQRVGLRDADVEAEVVAIEEAVLKVLLRSQQDAGTAA